MNKLRSFVVWVFEILGEAVGTALWMAALGFIFLHGTRKDLSFKVISEILGISTMILIEFALTGYLLTTLVLAQYLPRRQKFLYPLMSGFLYLIHSEIFFVALGNRILDKENLSIQIGGACIAFALTTIGDRQRVGDTTLESD